MDHKRRNLERLAATGCEASKAALARMTERLISGGDVRLMTFATARELHDYLVQVIKVNPTLSRMELARLVGPNNIRKFWPGAVEESSLVNGEWPIGTSYLEALRDIEWIRKAQREALTRF